MTATCSVPDCGAPHYGRGWCVAHYRRWARTGDPGTARPLRARTGEGYRAALRRLREARGPATGRPCAECGRPADRWSYDGTDPDERTDPGRGTRYSCDPTRYRPRCLSCHRRSSSSRRPVSAIDIERVIWLYNAGATTRGIGAVLGVSAATVSRALRAHGLELRPAGRPTRTSNRPRH